MSKENLKKMSKSILNKSKELTMSFVDSFKQTYRKTKENIIYVQKSITINVIDGKKGNKLSITRGIVEDDYIYIKEKDYLSLKSNFIKGNVIMNKQTCELFEIIYVNKKELINYKLTDKNNNYYIPCYKIEIRKITNLT